MRARWAVVLLIAALLGVAVYMLPRQSRVTISTGHSLVGEESGEVDEPHDLPPGKGCLTGRFLGPAGASFTGMGLIASGPWKGERGEDSRDLACTRIAADGSFDLHPLPAGHLAFEMVILDPSTPESSVLLVSGPFVTGDRIELGEVAIEADTSTRYDFDVRDRFPGTVRFAVNVNGEPAPGLRVTAKSDEDRLDWASAKVMADGAAVLGPLFPANWSLAVEGYGASYYENGEWTFLVPTSARIIPGVQVEVSVDIPLHDGTLTVLDARSGEPVAGGVVLLNDVDGGNVRRVTDSEGRINATLPPGTYHVRLWERGAREVQVVDIEWTASGPFPTTLRLLLPDPSDSDD